MMSEPEENTEMISTSTTKILTTSTTTENPLFDLPVDYRAYIMVLFSGTLIVLIWAFFIMFYFSRRRRDEQRFRHSIDDTHRNSTISVIDLPPKYETAIDEKNYPSVIVLDPSTVENERPPPSYQDVVSTLSD